MIKTLSSMGRKGITLIEILVAIALLGVVCITLMPVFSFSIRSLNFANSNTQAVLESTGRLEVVAATKAGVLFSDGTFIPQSQFPLGSSRFVVGATVLQSDIVKFLAGIPHIKLLQAPVAEGYRPDTAGGTIVRILVEGRNTHFIDTANTALRIRDKDGALVSYVSYGIVGKENAWINLSLGMLNEKSPYTVSFQTGGEIVSSLIMLGQPPYILVGNDKIMVSQYPKEYYEARNNPVSVVGNEVALERAVFASSREIDAAYYAVGWDKAGNGVVQRKRSEQGWEKLTVPQTAGKRLYGIAFNDERLVAVGEQGLVLTSVDGISWAESISGTSETLRSVNPIVSVDTPIRFIAVGEGESILTSEDGTVWTQRQAPPLSPPALQAAAFNGNGPRPAFRFDGTQLLKTVTAPVIGNSHRSVFIAMNPALDSAPAVNNDTILEWGRDGGPIPPATAGPRWTLRLDGAASNRLRVERGGGGYTGTLGISSVPVVAGQVWNGSGVHLYTATTTPSVSIDTAGTLTGVDTVSKALFLGGPISGWRTNDFMFKGDIAEVLVYDRALDAAESRAVSDYLTNRYIGEITGALTAPPSTGLKLWFDAENPGSGTVSGRTVVWADRSGQGNHAIGGFGLNAAAFGSISGTERFVIAGDNGQLFLSTDDCATWTRVSSLPTGEDINDIIFDGTRFIAAGDSGRLLTSTDGITWSSSTVGTATVWDVAHDTVNGLWLMVGNNGLVRTSEDGVSWTDRTALIPSAATNHFKCITFR